MTAELDRLRTALADRYRVEREIGSGGMATVYLAQDVRHDRQVAIKVLRADLASVIGPDRFLAEIKTTANLQHPHILGLIESGEVAGTVFYVMPFVRGESLRTRLEREQQLPIADAVRIATQVASALDYAHRSGIIHRDIKPENILLHDEQALVADFGIALAVTRSGDGRRRTEAGTSLGTPQYMSPEQAMGERTLDARTDVYSLGCVLYEMLAGEPPLAGPNAQATIAKVMTVEPEPVATLRRSVPRHIADATMTALQKVPADRFATAAEFSAALANPQFVAPSGAHRSATPATNLSRRDIAGMVAIVVLVVVALAGWVRRGAHRGDAVVRYELAADESMNSNQMVMARDGSRLLWGASNAYWERRFDTLGTRRIREAAVSPATIRDVSSEGRDVLVSGRGGLALAPLGGGPARVLAAQGPGRGGGGRGGAAIGYDRYVYFTADTRTIARVPLDSGRVDSVATAPDSTFINDIVTLPGGDGLIVSLQRNLSSSIYALDLRSKTWKTLAVGGPAARYVDDGYLLFANGQYVMAAPFDARKLAFKQPPVPYIEAGSDISMIATNGDVLAYRAGADAQGDVGIEVRTEGGDKRVLANVPDATRFSGFAVSPDGKRFVAVGTAISAPGTPSTSTPNLWVYELPSGPMPRLASTDRDNYPAWMPGGRDISFVRFSADSPYTSTMMRRSFDGITTPTPIVKRELAGGLLGHTSWFATGARAFVQLGDVFPGGIGGRGGRGGRGGGRGRGGPGGPGDFPQRGGPGGGRGRSGPSGDIVEVNVATPEQLRRVIPSDSAEASPAVNPNGKFFAYTSNNSGQTEVYVSPIDGSTRRQVSLNGGGTPRWSHDGRTLFYAVVATGPGTDTLYSARVSGTGLDISVEDTRVMLTGLNLGGGFGVLRGDTSFVMRASPQDDRRNLPPIVVVRNFAQELKRLFSAASSGSQ